MFNSAIVVSITVLVGVTVAGLAGYALSRFEFPGNGLIVAIVLFTQAIPTVVLSCRSTTCCTRRAHQHPSRPAPQLHRVGGAIRDPAVAGLLPDRVLTRYRGRGAGRWCSRFGVLWRIVLPLSLPGLISAAILIGVFAWNEFLWASLVAPREDIRTVAVGLNTFVGRFGANEQLPLWMAGAIFVAIPPLVLYMVAHRYVTVGYGVRER